MPDNKMKLVGLLVLAASAALFWHIPWLLIPFVIVAFLAALAVGWERISDRGRKLIKLGLAVALTCDLVFRQEGSIIVTLVGAAAKALGKSFSQSYDQEADLDIR